MDRGRSADILGGAQRDQRNHDEPAMTTITKGQRRIAHCECGAQLAAGSDEELFAVVERHLAHHHPQLMGALEPEVVVQMAEDVA
jgi:hypothetical protein